MSLVKANAILDASGGTTATINGYTPTVSNMATGNNRIINGAMMIDQRNAGASVTPSATATFNYTVDRFAYNQSAASKFAFQQNAGSVTPPVGYSNYLGFTSQSSYSVSSGDYFYAVQRIEANNVSDLAWGTANAATVTLSFWVRSSLTGTFGGTLTNNAGDRYYIFSYSIPSANTWTQISVTIAGDTSGTWVTSGNSTGIEVRWGLGSGSTYTGTAGSWSGTTYLQPTGSVNVVGTSGATFYITGVQLEAGSVATPFDFRQYGQELALCQRYYEQGNSGSVYFQTGTFAFSGSVVYYKIQKRATPTVVVSAGGVSGRIEITDAPTYDTAVNLAGTSEMFSATGTSNLFRSKIAYGYTASAEL